MSFTPSPPTAASSIGLGTTLRHLARELPGALSIDAHVQYSLLPTETTYKANPADFIGDYTAGGHIWNVGATLGFVGLKLFARRDVS